MDIPLLLRTMFMAANNIAPLKRALIKKLVLPGILSLVLLGTFVYSVCAMRKRY